MSGLCGWIGAAPAAARAGEVLSAMSARLNGIGEPDPGVVVNGAAVATQPGLVPVSTHRASSLLVALEGRPHRDKASAEGDAAMVAQLYRRHGGDCLRYVHGPCALAIIDTERSSGLLAVDRMGIRPLCYATPSGRLVFGSTADSVAAYPQVGNTISEQAVFNYLYCHVVPSPGTIYRGVYKLRPGECVVFENGSAERRFYWQMPYVDETTEPIEALEPPFRRLLRDALRRAVANDADIGGFLSGGTDSSTIAGLLSELRPGGAKTYSIGFAAEAFDEIRYARIAARHFATVQREYYLTPQDVADAIPLIAETYDEPFGNDSAVPAYFCARMARADGIRIMLAGDGGDELFGGNTRYARQKLFEAYARVPGVLRRALIEPLARLVRIRKLRSYIQQALVALPDRLESYNFLHRAPLAEIFDADFLAGIDPDEPLRLMRETYARTASRSAVNRMMHLDLTLTLADNDLRKVSRMCELAGVEARYPLLDEALVEFSAKLPSEWKVKGLRLRHFFKQALKDFLPRETIAKTKHGFGMPFGQWVGEHRPLGELVRASLDAFQRRGIITPRYVGELLRHREATHAVYFGKMIWVITLLEQWLTARKR